MATVMVLCGMADGAATAYDGQYLKEFDFEALDGQGSCDLTRDLREAKRFPTIKEAMEFRLRSPDCKPIREDGLPNRPLTATSWAMVTVPDLVSA